MHRTAEKVQGRLREAGLDVEVRELPDSTRTAAEAAAAIGCEIGQIVKTLVFVVDEAPRVVLCAGDRRVAADRLGAGARAAKADEVRAATGFAIGGVPPLGHDQHHQRHDDPPQPRAAAPALRPRRQHVPLTGAVVHARTLCPRTVSPGPPNRQSRPSEPSVRAPAGPPVTARGAEGDGSRGHQ